MKLLMHLFLSEKRPTFMVGNFIAEVTKVKNQPVYDGSIQAGIHFHDLIDKFINADPAVIRSRKRLNPKYSKYAAGIIDTFYDHFLAASWNQHNHQTLEEFAFNIYYTLLDCQSILPNKAKIYLQQMIQGNWLLKYANLSGINEIVEEREVKSTLDTYTVFAMEDLISDYHSFDQDFQELFTRLAQYAEHIKKYESVYVPHPVC